MVSCQRYDLRASEREERLRPNKKRLGTLFDELREGRIDIFFRASIQYDDLLASSVSGRQHIWQLACPFNRSCVY